MLNYLLFSPRTVGTITSELLFDRVEQVSHGNLKQDYRHVQGGQIHLPDHRFEIMYYLWKPSIIHFDHYTIFV